MYTFNISLSDFSLPHFLSLYISHLVLPLFHFSTSNAVTPNRKPISQIIPLPSLQIKIPPTSFSCSSQKRPQSYNAAINVPKLERVRISLPKKPIPSTKLVHQFNGPIQTPVPWEKGVITTSQTTFQDSYDPNKLKAIIQLHAILKIVAERVEMHKNKNIGEQRNKWKCLLMNSINTMMGHLKTAITHYKTPELTFILLLVFIKVMMVFIMSKIQTSKGNATTTKNGWSSELETEMRGGNLALKITKTIEILDPWLAGVEIISSTLVRGGTSWAGTVAVMAGSLADFLSVVEVVVFEMFGEFLQDTIES